MKISTKGRYGLRLMVDLAVHYEQGLVPLKEIAVRQEISEKYLEQIMMYSSTVPGSCAACGAPRVAIASPSPRKASHGRRGPPGYGRARSPLVDCVSGPEGARAATGWTAASP